MIDTIKDIKLKLASNSYRNEEHVRLNLITRILYKLGWDIWNPFEVDTEFVVSKQDDNTKVDFALRSFNDYPSVFIEVKAVGKITSLIDVETQLLNYNKYNTAPFSIISDGRKWYFYFSQTGGSMAQKRFKEIDLLQTDLSEIIETFVSFLSKEEVINGNAEGKAKEYLDSSREIRAIKDCEVAAEKLTKTPPYPRLPDAILKLMTERGYNSITLSRIENYLSNQMTSGVQPVVNNPVILTPSVTEQSSSRLITSIPDVRYATFVGHFNGKQVKDWNDLLVSSILEAFRRGITLEQIGALLRTNFRRGEHGTEGFKYLPELDISFQRMSASNCLSNAYIVAQKYGCKMDLVITWGNQGVFPNETKQFCCN